MMRPKPEVKKWIFLTLPLVLIIFGFAKNGSCSSDYSYSDYNVGRNYPESIPESSQPDFPSLSNNDRGNLLVVLPNVLLGGTTEVFCITVTNMTEPIYIKFNLLDRSDILADYPQYFMEFPYACLEYEIPAIERSSLDATLILMSAKFPPNATTYDTKLQKQVKIKKPSFETFIETDKPIYKPGQDIKFRVLILDHKLKPILDSVDTIFVEAPNGNRMAQWENIIGEEGLIDLELPMTPDPILGTWKIGVLFDGQRKEKTFTVEEYVLPKFEVDITGQSYVIVNETSVTFKVCGRYTYGQPVQGSFTAEISLATSWSRMPRSLLPFSIDDTGVDGCHEFEVGIESFMLGVNDYSMYDAKIAISVSFTETVTGVTLDAEKTDVFVTKIPLELSIVSPDTYKPGLPYFGELKVTHPDGKPAIGQQVSILDGGSETYNTDSTGSIHFISHHDSDYFNLRASIPNVRVASYNYRVNTVSYQVASKLVRSDYSVMNEFIQIRPVMDTAKVGSTINLLVDYTGSSPINSRKFTVTLMSRGDIIRPLEGITKTDVSNFTAANYGTLQVSFSVSFAMGPILKVLVFGISPLDNILADSAQVKVQQKFNNDVNIQFANDERRPGETTQLDISATPNSLCGLGIVDKSVSLLGGSNSIKASQIVSSLNAYELNEGSGVRDPLTCIQAPNRQSRYQVNDRTKKDASAAFREVGFTYLTNMDLVTAVCPEVPLWRGGIERNFNYPVFMMAPEVANKDGSNSYMFDDDDVEYFGATSIFDESAAKKDDAPRIRSYFPETWLWKLHRTSSESGQVSVSLTVPDTVTEWIGGGFCVSSETGIGVSSTTSIRAFQPFFLSYTLPYSVIRGEEVPVKVTVFNYLAVCIVVELTLSDSDNFTLAADEVRVKEMCVCGSQSGSVEFNILPKILGDMPLEVTGVSIDDGSTLCGNEVMTVIENAGDAIRKDLLVEAEGIEQEFTKNEFFCPSELENGRFIWNLTLNVPEDIVPDTAWAKVTVSGDVMGQTLSNLDHLIAVPYGCGEQNMITMVPNILAMDYLLATDQLTEEQRLKAKKNMEMGYQRELTYRHRDMSYSAFGKSDASGSTWLTAYVVQSFARAKEYIFIDNNDLSRSIDWLKGLQNRATGCFRSVGNLCHKDMLGGVNNDLTLSAFVIISMRLAGVPANDRSILKGLRCLHREIDSVTDNYAITQMAYAMSLADSSHFSRILAKLESAAVVDSGLKHWESNRAQTSQSSYAHHGTTSTDTEMTSYALLTYINYYPTSDAVAEGTGISKWIISQRTSRGAFASTQDTVLGLTALAKYSEIIYSGDLALHFIISSSAAQTGFDGTTTFDIQNSNRLLLREAYLDNIPTELFMEGSGLGCAIVSVTTFYNLNPVVDEAPSFMLLYHIQEQEVEPCKNYMITVCMSYNGGDYASNMAVLHVKMVSGFYPNKDALRTIKDSRQDIKRIDIEGKSVEFYFDQISYYETCVEIHAIKEIDVKNTKPGIVTIYDYYDTKITTSTKYTLDCSLDEEIIIDVNINPLARAGGNLIELPMGAVGPGAFANRCPPGQRFMDGVKRCIPDESECERRAREAREEGLLGSYRPQCTETGDYRERQCHTSTGFCWCLDGRGVEIEGTRQRGMVDCALCPLYSENLPDDWSTTFCASDYVMSFRIRVDERGTYLANYRNGKEDHESRIVFAVEVGCNIAFEVGERYLAFTGADNVDLSEGMVNMSQSTLIVPFNHQIKKALLAAVGTCPET